jgi:hypothetical protein
MPNDAFEMLSVGSDNIIRPGTMNAPYGTPPTSDMPEPMAAPNTTKYSEVVSTGVTTLWPAVRRNLAISKR